MIVITCIAYAEAGVVTVVAFAILFFHSMIVWESLFSVYLRL